MLLGQRRPLYYILSRKFNVISGHSLERPLICGRFSGVRSRAIQLKRLLLLERSVLLGSVGTSRAPSRLFVDIHLELPDFKQWSFWYFAFCCIFRFRIIKTGFCAKISYIEFQEDSQLELMLFHARSSVESGMKLHIR
jgi:hypothetical protein